MKSLIAFLQCVLEELGTWCGTSTIFDLKTIEERVEHEGLSFLTITLPNFGKDFQKSLDLGYVGDDHFLGFSRNGGLPRFLSGFLHLVFDSKSGRLLDVPSIDAIFAIRQITLAFAKIDLPCTQARIDHAIDRYIECEQEVRIADTTLDPDRIVGFKRIATLLWSDLFQSVDEDIYYGRVIPGHGPGATADKLKGNLKWTQLEWPERLDEEFSFLEFLVPNARYRFDILDRGINFLEPGAERPVRVITVPKTLKTPRIIAVEPTAMQYAQQGIHAVIQERIEEFDIPQALIGYSSQVPNQNLAREGSLDGSLATLDMREASDRVSNQHVRLLLHNFPNLFRAVDACRSRKADVPGYGVIRLAKFASMGSALCFPFEAIVFMTIIFLGIERALNRQLTREDIISFFGKVRVYGDDIVIPVEYVSSVSSELHAFGHVVNLDKSYWNGKFRESCGKDYYDGVDVSLVRLRHLFPSGRRDGTGIISTVATRNLFYDIGMWRTAKFLDTMLERIIPFPPVSRESQLLGRFSYLVSAGTFSYPHERWDDQLHLPLVKGIVVDARIPASKLEDYPALLKCLAKRSDLPFADARHLDRSGRPSAVSTKLRWASPY